MNREIGTKIFRGDVKFIAGAESINRIPNFPQPQIAFIGKSNVGKSSLVNKLCARKALARVSHTPGRTRQINFFSIEDKLILVDLPGYGFADVPLTVKENWERLIIHYLKNTDTIAMVNVLIDARRGIKDNDVIVIDLLLEYQVPFQIVFTKADKVTEREKFLENNKNYLVTLNYSCNVILTSSKNGTGAKELQLSLVKSVETFKEYKQR